MKFLSSSLTKSSRHLYLAARAPSQAPAGEKATEGPLTNEHLTEEAQKDVEIQKKLKELNSKFGNQIKPEELAGLIKQADHEPGDKPEENNDGKLEELGDLNRLEQLIQEKLNNPGDKAGGGEKSEIKEKKETASNNLTQGVLRYLDPAGKNGELRDEIMDLSKNYINDIKDEAKLNEVSEKLKNNDVGLIKEVGDKFRAKVKDYLSLSMGVAKDNFPKAEFKDLDKIGEALGNAYAEVLAHLKKSDKPIPGITQESVDPKASALIRQKTNETLSTLKGKSADEVVKALSQATESIAKAVQEDPVITEIAKSKEKAFNSKSLSNESLATSIIETGEDDADKTLGLSNGSIRTTKEAQAAFKAGKEETIKFEGSENLKTIGAGDLYPAEVRGISINGKEASREGIAGGFFYADGSYAKILTGDKVKITQMEDEGSENMKTLYKNSRTNADKFKFEYKGEDKDIEIAPGQKFKQSELVAQMAERYGIDPHLLMSQASEITSAGNDYLKDLNMTARATQRTLKSSGVDKKDWYQEKDGRRFMNPKVLRKFIGGNEKSIDNYVANSGAKYEEKDIKDLKEQYPGLEGREPGEKLSSAEVRQILGKSFSVKGGAQLDGYTAHATKGLLAFNEFVKNANPGKSAKGVITDLTDQNIHSKKGAHRHDNGYKADIRSTDAYGQMIAKATGMHRPQKGTKTFNLGEAGTVVVRRHGPADHFDLQFKPA